jgi:hypothetical protein
LGILPNTNILERHYTRILFRIFLRAYSWQYECYFWADAVGKNGPYCAASSPKYKIYGRVWAWDEAANPPFGNKEKDTKMSRQILDNLVNSLIKEGWQMLSERGAHVWQYKLKRKISA